ncbi:MULTISPECIES: helix-turn-helix domain-containing protein [Sphingobacterium]|uniref:helix-turn-helix domain-containing protein n=1 Tax=Sphingobacterium TaxID=28453 RepID=UPI00257F0399|nr:MULTISPECIES: helix-turn-helix transcriptional regulator [Sphingobacterium]
MEASGNVRTLSKGQKIEQIRKLMGISQAELGRRLDISKQAVSKMERARKIGQEKLAKVVYALNAPTDAIENFSQDRLVFHIQNMYDSSTACAHNLECNYNTLDKVIELYERLLQLEKDKVQILKDKLKQQSPIR